jgi:hypothetical protein
MAHTLNHDVYSLCTRIHRFCQEIHHSASSGAADLMSSWDAIRLKDYIRAIRTYRQWVTSQPFLDLPETHQGEGRELEFPDSKLERLPEVDNLSVVDCCNLLSVCQNELIHSQSSRQASGLIEFDAKRLDAIIDKVESLLTDYIEQATPLDMPESSPSRVMSGPGKTGI